MSKDTKFNEVPPVVSVGEAFVVCTGRTDVGRDYEVYVFVAGCEDGFQFKHGGLRKLEAMNKARALNEKPQA